MRLADILSVDRIDTSLSAGDKAGALAALARLFGGLEQGEVERVLADREAIASTGVGSGVAIPHARIPGLAHLRAALALCAEGVDFDALDGQPVHIFFAVLAPEERAGEHLKALARISRLLRDEGVRKRLLECAGPEEAFALLVGEDERRG